VIEMAKRIFGIDFGTTNSLAAVHVGSEMRSLTSEDRPIPSVVWYRGGEVVVGREARDHLESIDTGAAQGFIRSPKMELRRDGPIYVDGRPVEPTDAVATVLAHVRREAARQGEGYAIDRAVMTIPIDFAGPQRRKLREAARKAGISVVQFVHEPAAALYAHLRSQPDFRRRMAELENRAVLVFDWGGGTLDLTVCRILRGEVMQIANRGNNQVGGDRFDERVRNLIRDKHAAQHGLSDIHAHEHEGVAARVLIQCEQAKIGLSTRDSYRVLVPDYLRLEGPARNLAVDISRNELEGAVRHFVAAGLAEIDKLLEGAGLDRGDIERCVATGGMVNMPAIWQGLVERFTARVASLPNRDRLIAEGAAWIAHDGLRLTLAKPLELVFADGGHRGAYLPLVGAGFRMPVENETIPVDHRRLVCVDPRDGVAVFEFVKPKKVGLLQPGDERELLCALNLPIDPEVGPFAERLECRVTIDADYVARLSVTSKLREATCEAEIHSLDFALAMPIDPPSQPGEDPGHEPRRDPPDRDSPAGRPTPLTRSNVVLRSNVVAVDGSVGDDKRFEDWTCVPGDLVEKWRPNYLRVDTPELTPLQRAEAMLYRPCAVCGRSAYLIRRDGPTETCRRRNCPESRRPTPHRD
jgi:actin-like ATPase involved in cell morphogenesis